jgi:glycoprotein-N-acetylgalactosamine 3-beta-galactosyltransferase
VEDEDVEIGYCLNRLNITAGDSRDGQKRGRFHPLSPASTLIPLSKIDDWYPDAIYYKFQIVSSNSIHT